MKSGTLRFGVELPSLFQEIARHTEVRESPGAILGLEIIQKSLYKIATRAIELDDKLILDELLLIGVIHPDPADSDTCPKSG